MAWITTALFFATTYVIIAIAAFITVILICIESVDPICTETKVEDEKCWHCEKYGECNV